MKTSEHIVFSEVNKHFGEIIAVNSLTLTINRGEIFVFVGPSGCGKSTTLQLINRLVEADSGKIFIDGTSIDELDPVQLRRRIGYVIQQIGLFPHKTVASNVGTVCRLQGWSRSSTKTRVRELLELVDLDPDIFLERYPHELSGGQQQRVGVARALAISPSILLMDEPFGALDPIVRRQLQGDFRRWVAKLGTTVVFVTHDVDEAISLADQMVVLGSGCIVEQIGTPLEILSKPASTDVENFIGTDRILRALATIPITEVMRRSVANADSQPKDPLHFREDQTAYDALASLLNSGKSNGDVLDSGGQTLGKVSWDDLLATVQKIDKE